MDRAGLDPLVSRSRQVGAGLERVVSDISQQGSGEGARRVDERRLVAPLVLD